MDRREALRKMGAGSAAVVGASLVMSSPAFAFAAPEVIGVPNSFTLTKLNNETALITLQGTPAGECPTSSTNTNDVPVQGATSYSWQIAPASLGTGPVVRKVGNWTNGDSVTVTVTVPYTCTYAGSSTTQCYRWVRVFTSTAQAGAGSFTPGEILGPTAVDC